MMWSGVAEAVQAEAAWLLPGQAVFCRRPSEATPLHFHSTFWQLASLWMGPAWRPQLPSAVSTSSHRLSCRRNCRQSAAQWPIRCHARRHAASGSGVTRPGAGRSGFPGELVGVLGRSSASSWRMVGLAGPVVASGPAGRIAHRSMPDPVISSDVRIVSSRSPEAAVVVNAPGSAPPGGVATRCESRLIHRHPGPPEGAVQHLVLDAGRASLDARAICAASLWKTSDSPLRASSRRWWCHIDSGSRVLPPRSVCR